MQHAFHSKRHSITVALRTLLAIFGGWGFSWGLVAAGTTGLVALGIPFHDAETAFLMIGLLVYLSVFLWSFATYSLLRVCTVLLGGASCLNGTAFLLQHALLS